MSAKPQYVFGKFVDAIVTERKPANPRGPGRINHQWDDYGATFTAVVTYRYEPDGELLDGRWADCSSVELCTCTLTHINGKALAHEVELNVDLVPGDDVLEDNIRYREQRL